MRHIPEQRESGYHVCIRTSTTATGAAGHSVHTSTSAAGTAGHRISSPHQPPAPPGTASACPHQPPAPPGTASAVRTSTPAACAYLSAALEPARDVVLVDGGRLMPWIPRMSQLYPIGLPFLRVIGVAESELQTYDSGVAFPSPNRIVPCVDPDPRSGSMFPVQGTWHRSPFPATMVRREILIC